MIGAVIDFKTDHIYPPNRALIDVTKSPYNAKGDGIADDTAALQQAISDVMGRHLIVYLPNGTYLVSRTLMWSKKNSQGGEAWGFNIIHGENAHKTVIKLKNGVFTDPSKAQAIMWCGGFGSADWFHNYVEGLTFDVGRDNPGAIGLQFYSNNTGALRDVRIISQDGKGTIGLDLAHRDMNGPLLVRNVTVDGFQKGVRTGASVNSQTFERITLSHQTQVGFSNEGQHIAVRGLLSDNAVTAVINDSGVLSLLDARLVGHGKTAAAIVNRGKAALLARDVVTAGYSGAIEDDGRPGVTTSSIKEYCSGTPTSPFATATTSLRLPVREIPEIPWDDAAGWAVVDAFGADPEGRNDSSEAVQKAIDSGATTVFMPGSYQLKTTVIVRGKVRRVLGAANWINYGKSAHPDLRISEGEGPVCIEQFQLIGGGIEIATKRAVVVRSVESKTIAFNGTGEVFLEDVCTSDLRIGKQHVWARQLNIENQGTHLTNDGGDVWILGYKTERGGTLVDTRAGGRTEVMGTLSYTTTAGKLAPMFVTTDASVYAFFGEICFSGDPFTTLISETRNGQTHTVERGSGWVAPYIGYPGTAK